MAGPKCAMVDMYIWTPRDKLLIILRYTEHMGWIVCGKESIEKTVKFAFAYVTDVANLHGAIQSPRTWPRLPQGISIRRICDRKLFAKDVVVGHWGIEVSLTRLETRSVLISLPVRG